MDGVRTPPCLVVQMGTSDQAMSQLDGTKKRAPPPSLKVQKQVVALVNTPEGKALLEKIATARQQALGTVAKRPLFVSNKILKAPVQ